MLLLQHLGAEMLVLENKLLQPLLLRQLHIYALLLPLLLFMLPGPLHAQLLCSLLDFSVPALLVGQQTHEVL